MRTGQEGLRWGRLTVLIGIIAIVVIGVWVSRPPRQARAPIAAERAGPIQSALSADERERVDRTVATGRVVLPEQVSALIQSRRTITAPRTPGPLFSPISPVSTAVRAARPQFTWSEAGADAYTVAIFDTDGGKEIVRSERIGGTSWTPREDLPRGGTYRWEVTAHRGARNETEPRPPRPDARFIVLDLAAAQQIDAIAARLASEPLALGILLAEAGLVSEARVDLTRAVKVPATAAPARRLLESLDK